MTLHLNLLHQKVLNVPLQREKGNLILPLSHRAGQSLGDLLITFREELEAPEAQYSTTSSLSVKSQLHHSQADIQNLLVGKIDIG
jgi:hypothetical protein